MITGSNRVQIECDLTYISMYVIHRCDKCRQLLLQMQQPGIIYNFRTYILLTELPRWVTASKEQSC